MLRKTVLSELLDASRLPSGVSYCLKPSTVETGLKVSEVSDPLKWRSKAAEVMAITESVNGMNVKTSGGVEFISGLLDTDVLFLTMAWNADVNGRTLKFDKSIPCPSCTEPFQSVDIGVLVVMVRDEPATGPSTIHRLEVEPQMMARLPASIRDGKISVKDPTWAMARSKIPVNSQSDLQSVDMHRALCSLMVENDGKPIRPVIAAEYKQFPMAMIRVILDQLDQVVPNFAPIFQITCKGCGVEIDIPFDRAGG